jgi:hypothetical protein
MASIFRPTYTEKKTGRTRKLRRWYVKYRELPSQKTHS